MEPNILWPSKLYQVLIYVESDGCELCPAQRGETHSHVCLSPYRLQLQSCGLQKITRIIRNPEISAVGTISPAEEKKRTMIVLIREMVAPVGSFPLGWTVTSEPVHSAVLTLQISMQLFT